MPRFNLLFSAHPDSHVPGPGEPMVRCEVPGTSAVQGIFRHCEFPSYSLLGLDT